MAAPKERRYCHTCNKLFLVSKDHHEKHKIQTDITDDLLRRPTHLLNPLDTDDKQAQFFFADSALNCIVNIFQQLKFE